MNGMEIYKKISSQLEKKTDYTLKIVEEKSMALLLSKKGNPIGELHYNQNLHQLTYIPISYSQRDEVIKDLLEIKASGNIFYNQHSNTESFFQPELPGFSIPRENFLKAGWLFKSLKNLDLIVEDNEIPKEQLCLAFN
ncbi:MAG: hypothetical protein PHT94_02745 [Candidatus Nanoarchaeia archaeon]|nr:hypothetical protein [Candidatus Nanoarchaeia archaeon]